MLIERLIWKPSDLGLQIGKAACLDMEATVPLPKTFRKAQLTAALQRLADQLEPSLRRRFLNAVRQVQDGIELERLAQAIEIGSVTSAEVAAQIGTWPEKFGGLALDLKAGFLAGASAGIGQLESVGLSMRFDVINPFAVQHARNRLAPIVQSFRDGAIEVIRDFTYRATQGEFTPSDAAQRIKDWIGLTPQQVNATTKFEADLLEKGIPLEKVADRLGKYVEAQMDARALMIARMEIQTAANAGQMASWQEAQRQGLLSPETKKLWSVANDERLCPVCESIGAADSIPLNAQFRDDTGQLMTNVFGEPLFEPPQHPNCRCSLVLDL